MPYSTPAHPAHASLTRAVIALALFAAVTGPSPALAQTVDYSRAERFLTWNTERIIAGAEVIPNWMETGDTDRFWYRNNTGSGYEFVLVDPAAGQPRTSLRPLPPRRGHVARQRHQLRARQAALQHLPLRQQRERNRVRGQQQTLHLRHHALRLHSGRHARIATALRGIARRGLGGVLARAQPVRASLRRRRLDPTHDRWREILRLRPQRAEPEPVAPGPGAAHTHARLVPGFPLYRRVAAGRARCGAHALHLIHPTASPSLLPAVRAPG